MTRDLARRDLARGMGERTVAPEEDGNGAAKAGGWNVPLYLQIAVALALGVGTGLLLPVSVAKEFNTPAVIILRLLGAIAPPLILVAVMRALIRANVRGPQAGRLFFLLALNTTVAIFIGLLVANVLQPGSFAQLPPGEARNVGGNMVQQLLDNIPSSLVRPLVENNVIGVIFIAVAFALAARRLAGDGRAKVLAVVDLGFELILVVLHWIIAAVPVAVFCKVAFVVGTQGFRPFLALGGFIVAVVIALALQAAYYLTRVRIKSWVTPARLLTGTKDALAMAFSTASSTVTMPVTYATLRQKVGLREESASLGALVGSNFNNDGTALYEAMAALFIAQMVGADLSLTQQVLVVLTSVIASVGAAGIPEAGLVTMTLVFTAVGLPTGYIALLLPVDWFLDRCRTTINVMGDINVSCILDGKTPMPHEPEPDTSDALLRNIA
jgi:Na+/H+-dicarboxylate symporter